MTGHDQRSFLGREGGHQGVVRREVEPPSARPGTAAAAPVGQKQSRRTTPGPAHLRRAAPAGAWASAAHTEQKASEPGPARSQRTRRRRTLPYRVAERRQRLVGADEPAEAAARECTVSCRVPASGSRRPPGVCSGVLLPEPLRPSPPRFTAPASGASRSSPCPVRRRTPEAVRTARPRGTPVSGRRSSDLTIVARPTLRRLQPLHAPRRAGHREHCGDPLDTEHLLLAFAQLHHGTPLCVCIACIILP